MLAKVNTCSIVGLSVSIIEVEVDISNGLPVTNVVGLADTAIKESKERVRAAIKNSGLDFPMKRITINLAPADVKKEGTQFDLPIAMGILAASNQMLQNNFSDIVMVGELSLDGTVNGIHGILPILLSCYQKGIRKVIIPSDNLEEAKIVDDMEIIGVRNLSQIFNHFQGIEIIKNDDEELFNSKLEQEGYYEDFEDLLGQENLKRSLEIAASGNHNLLMVGPPGSGKTMAAKRLPSILPKPTFEESIEITKIYSIAGMLKNHQGLITQRPFRSPHHTSSVASLAGGGRIPKPGEVSLSHYGVLFLDELPEFSKAALEILRQPLEDKVIHISRVNGSYTYPSDFMLIASMNPCPCGFFGTDQHERCHCTLQQIKKYTSKISGPLLDRIDMIIETTRVNYEDLKQNKKSESSSSIRLRVQEARNLQLERYKKTKYLFNSQLDQKGIKKYCSLNQEAQKLMDHAYDKFKLSARGYNRLLKVARTVADLSGKDIIEEVHLAEALQFRNINIEAR